MNRRVLLRRFLEAYPFQPATAVWRSVEIGHVIDRGFPAGRGLDLGCGDGLLTKIVLDAVGPRTMVGLDPDEAEIALAQKLGLYERLHCAGAEGIPEPSGTFSFVFSNSVLEHIPDLDPVLSEVSRVLETGGRFLFTVPGPSFHEALRGPLLFPSRRADYLERLDRRLAHHRYWTAEQWGRTLRDNGMGLVETSEYLDRTEARRWETIARLTAGALHLLYRRRRSPIEIQRSLGLRGGQRMPSRLAAALAAVLALGLRGSQPPFSGLRVVAIKS
jgi:SAM-dependent methyltransferase